MRRHNCTNNSKHNIISGEIIGCTLYIIIITQLLCWMENGDWIKLAEFTESFRWRRHVSQFTCRAPSGFPGLPDPFQWPQIETWNYLLQIPAFWKTHTIHISRQYYDSYVKTVRTYTVVVPFNHLQEQGRSVLHWLGEDLQQVAIVIKVNKDVQLL